jgi:hypothetical protein
MQLQQGYIRNNNKNMSYFVIVMLLFCFANWKGSEYVLYYKCLSYKTLHTIFDTK